MIMPYILDLVETPHQLLLLENNLKLELKVLPILTAEYIRKSQIKKAFSQTIKAKEYGYALYNADDIDDKKEWITNNTHHIKHWNFYLDKQGSFSNYWVFPHESVLGFHSRWLKSHNNGVSPDFSMLKFFYNSQFIQKCSKHFGISSMQSKRKTIKVNQFFLAGGNLYKVTEILDETQCICEQLLYFVDDLCEYEQHFKCATLQVLAITRIPLYSLIPVILLPIDNEFAIFYVIPWKSSDFDSAEVEY